MNSAPITLLAAMSQAGIVRGKNQGLASQFAGGVKLEFLECPTVASLLIIFGNATTHPNALNSRQRQKYAITTYDVETFCSLSTQFLTVGRFIMRSCQAV